MFRAPTAVRRKDETYAEYVIHPASTVTLEMVKTASYWVNLPQLLEVGDVVEVFPKDRTYYARLLLIQKRPGAYVWQTLEHHEFQVKPVIRGGIEFPEFDLRVEHLGDDTGWAVIDTAVNPPIEIAAGFATREDAEDEARAVIAARENGN